MRILTGKGCQREGGEQASGRRNPTRKASQEFPASTSWTTRENPEETIQELFGDQLVSLFGTIWRPLQDHFTGGEHEGPSEESVRFSKRADGPEAFSNERMVQKLFQVSMKLLQWRIFH